MEQGLQTRLPIYVLIGATTILGTLLFMDWTADKGLAPLVDLFYHQQQIKTFQEQLKIIIKTAYYFAILAILCYAAAEVYERIKRKQEGGSVPHFSQTTKEALVVSFHAFVIFEAFFYYLLNNDGDDLSRKYINLLPFWFLASWTVYMVGAWLARWAQLKLYVSGIIMLIILWTFILGEIYQNGFIHRALSL